MRLSVIVITKNEATMIRRCLASVAWADEIIVVDSGSTDHTVAICQEFTPHVIRTDWPGFGPQKNRALSYATGTWVLSLDADEYLTSQAQAEIQQVLSKDAGVNAYRMPRLSSYCGRFMGHGGWYPDYIVRLFRRGHARFSEDLVHERLVVDGAIGTLHAPLHHETYRDLEEVLYKIDSYSTAGAAMAAERGRRGSLMGAVAHGLWSFVRTYFVQLGVLDGAEGLMLAISNAEVTYYKYLKLRLLNKAQDNS
ncbi:MAG: glycosyltransferase family 2 protein [Acidiferrobacter sp.]